MYLLHVGDEGYEGVGEETCDWLIKQSDERLFYIKMERASWQKSKRIGEGNVEHSFCSNF